MSLGNKLAAFFLCIFLLLVVTVGGIIVYERMIVSRFEDTPLNISESSLKNKWGEPTKTQGNAQSEVLFYRTIFTYYAFSINNERKVIHKYQD